jgi:hypothetical protein
MIEIPGLTLDENSYPQFVNQVKKGKSSRSAQAQRLQGHTGN